MTARQKEVFPYLFGIIVIPFGVYLAWLGIRSPHPFAHDRFILYIVWAIASFSGVYMMDKLEVFPTRTRMPLSKLRWFYTVMSALFAVVLSEMLSTTLMFMHSMTAIPTAMRLGSEKETIHALAPILLWEGFCFMATLIAAARGWKAYHQEQKNKISSS